MKRGTVDTTSSSFKASSQPLSKEQILNSLHDLYVHPEQGLLKIGQTVGLTSLFAPRRKVNILLMGNHSSGKSTFINWYIESKVQKTGVAIETQEFTLITCARQRETLTGNATLRVFPYLKPLENINGVVPYLHTELVPSKARRFNLVTFMDTPGLADGELSYPYDIEQAILFLADKVDLIFVFFDPIGQALCKRTISLVESLSNRFSERMRFFLSKADEAGDERDRQKVMIQIVQELCKRPGLDQSGFEMQTIYIPEHDGLKRREVMCANQIDDVCEMIDKTIALTIQKSFKQTETDLNQIEELLHNSLKRHEANARRNFRKIMKMVMFIILALHFPLSILLHVNNDFDNWLQNTSIFTSSDESITYVLMLLYKLVMFYSLITFTLFRVQTFLLKFSPISVATIGFVFITIPVFLISKYMLRLEATLRKKEYEELKQMKLFLEQARQKRENLFETYLKQMLIESDSY